jgi:hypothetical protein
MEDLMPYKPVESRDDDRDFNTFMLLGAVLAAFLVLGLIFGASLFTREKSGVMNKPQPNIETPTTGETKKP